MWESIDRKRGIRCRALLAALLLCLAFLPVMRMRTEAAQTKYIVLSKNSVKLYKGQTCKISAKKIGLAGKKITWSSNDTSIATVKNGKIKAVGKGTCQVFATAGKVTARCQVQVRKSRLSVSKKKLTLDQNETFKVTAKLNGSTLKKAIWSSSDKSVATVSSKGKIKGVGAGTATITVRSGGEKATVKVTVTAVSSAGSMNKTKLAISAGNGYSLYVTYPTSQRQYTYACTWTSSNERVAVVNNAGRVTAISAGTATITAEMDGSVWTCKVIVSTGKSRIAVEDYIGTNITTAAQLLGAGEVNEYPERVGGKNSSFTHACVGSSLYLSYARYYTGISDYAFYSSNAAYAAAKAAEEAYDAAQYDIRLEAFESGNIVVIESKNGSDKYSYFGAYVGMEDADVDNILTAHGFKCSSGSTKYTTYREINGNRYIKVAVLYNKVVQIYMYASNIT